MNLATILRKHIMDILYIWSILVDCSFRPDMHHPWGLQFGTKVAFLNLPLGWTRGHQMANNQPLHSTTFVIGHREIMGLP
jgi:hypothetical protein